LAAVQEVVATCPVPTGSVSPLQSPLLVLSFFFFLNTLLSNCYLEPSDRHGSWQIMIEFLGEVYPLPF